MERPTKRIAIYTRVSTLEQNPGMQREELLRYARDRVCQLVDVYEDKATGLTTGRPAFQRLMNDARLRKFDLVVVWKFDRLARSLKHLVLSIQELTEYDVELISLRDNIDMGTSSGRLMLHMVAAFAEFEASLIRERCMAGLAHARARGIRLGRPPVVDRDAVMKLRASGLSMGAIASRTGISKSAVHKTLSKQA